MPLKRLRIEGNIMIRVRRIDTPKARAAVRALEVAKENNRSYNIPEVNAALTEMFKGICQF